jgi:hypothetical protein
MTGDEQQQAGAGPGGPFEGGFGGFSGFSGFENFYEQFRGAQGMGGQKQGENPFGDVFEEFEKMFSSKAKAKILW